MSGFRRRRNLGEIICPTNPRRQPRPPNVPVGGGGVNLVVQEDAKSIKTWLLQIELYHHGTTDLRKYKKS